MFTEICIPDIGSDEVEVTEIMVNIGDSVVTEQSIITVESDKTLIEIPSPFSGTVKEIKISIGDKIKTGFVIMVFDTIDSSQKTKTLENLSKSQIPCTKKYTKNNLNVHATPIIRRLAREFDINLANINGTGRKNRILREDIQTYIKQAIKFIENNTLNNSIISNICTQSSKHNNIKNNEIQEIKIGRIQKISNKNITNNWMTIPHVTLIEDIDITELEKFRKNQNKKLEKKHDKIKITILSFIIKAVAHALEKNPKINSSISKDGNKLFLKKYINIGIAVDTFNGLLVPIIKNPNKKGIIEISNELIDISNKAKSEKLIPSDMQNGCITISNLGTIGTTAFTPIINGQETAIIGISRSSIKAVWDENKFIPRNILPISLSFDHRIIDGADGARFLITIKKIINDIRYLIM
ncbi:Dihydrolipoyllysine-residue acetyltransferase component of pyruvate dehydrogenase complex [Candidatus Providencia siddallii]|uniref:Dihydrolipoamide acetyltransferase component of pyruvate dehydrogenase complex n=1 Tax=Candidatus Providencia siddallii TaxID=1715285 RepID=A0ABM9NP11_9GAMM